MDKLIKECVYCQGKEPELTPYAYIPVCERHLKNPELLEDTMPNLINKALEEFREKFLMKDSECTWEGYPLPEQIEDFWISKLQQVRRETAEEVEKKCWTENGYFREDTQEALSDVLYLTQEIIKSTDPNHPNHKEK